MNNYMKKRNNALSKSLVLDAISSTLGAILHSVHL